MNVFVPNAWSRFIGLARPQILALLLIGAVGARAADAKAPAKSGSSDLSLAGAREAMRAQQLDQALVIWSALIERTPGDARYWMGRADCYMRLSQRNLALNDYTQAINLDPKRAEGYSARAKCYITLGMADNAYKDDTDAIAREPKNVQPYAHRAATELILKKITEALEDFNQCLVLLPHNPDFLIARAIAYSKQGDNAAALDDLDDAAIVESNRPNLHEMRARIYLALGRNDQALSEFNEAIRLSKNRASSYNALAWVLANSPDLSFRNSSRALDLATKACQETNWKNYSYLDTLAAAYAEAGDYAQAVTWQLAAIKLSSKLDEADLRSRLVLYQQHQPYRLPISDPKAIAWDNLRYESFNLVWQTVDQEYFDPKLNGIDWRRVRERYRAKLGEAKDAEALRGVLQQMLNELHRTHFAIIPRSATVFTVAERTRQGTTGARLGMIKNQLLVAAVTPNSAAAKGGLNPGDVIVRANGVTLSSIIDALDSAGVPPGHAALYLKSEIEGLFNGPVGSLLKLQV
jgi:tetratricopeptide (TPR) repeat protein